MKNSKKDSKQMLFEMMHKVGGLPLKENSNNDPTKEEMLNFLKEKFKGLIDPMSVEDNEFDMVQAIYFFAREYHGGQWSNLYSTLSTSNFSPNPRLKDIYETGDEQSIMMYEALVDRYGN